MNYQHFIGMDVSKDTLDIAVFDGNRLLFHEQISNDAAGLRNFFKQLKSLPGFSLQQSLFCMEHTGIYNQHALQFLHGRHADICLEAAVHIQHASGLQRGKNDKIDAIRIAQYAYKNREELRLWKPQRAVVQQLARLATMRNRLIAARKQLTVPLEEGRLFEKKITRQLQELSQSPIRALEKSIEKTDRAIAKVIATDPELKRLFAIVTSVEGIGKVTAVQMIITTGEFTTITDPARFACYAGVAPFAYTSGTSMKGKMHVSHRAHKPMKTLLHLCAVSAVRANTDLKHYFDRKAEENKHKMSILNAVRNKLIWRVFACVRENRLYQKKYDRTLV